MTEHASPPQTPPEAHLSQLSHQLSQQALPQQPTTKHDILKAAALAY